MTIRNSIAFLLLLVPLLLIAGCDRGDDSVDESEDFDELIEDDPLADLTPEERAAYDLAVAKIEPALGDDIDEIRLLSLATTEWPDSSLGCPQAGVEYIQVVTPGFSVRLGAAGRSYVVNTGGDQAVVCNQPGASVLQRPNANIHASQVASARDRAIADLAEKLDVDPSLIQASQLIPGTWTSSALGCPEPGVEYAEGPVTGFQMFLGYGDRAYTYNTDGEKVIPCPPISVD